MNEVCRTRAVTISTRCPGNHGLMTATKRVLEEEMTMSTFPVPGCAGPGDKEMASPRVPSHRSSRPITGHKTEVSWGKARKPKEAWRGCSPAWAPVLCFSGQAGSELSVQGQLGVQRMRERARPSLHPLPRCQRGRRLSPKRRVERSRDPTLCITSPERHWTQITSCLALRLGWSGSGSQAVSHRLRAGMGVGRAKAAQSGADNLWACLSIRPLSLLGIEFISVPR